MKDNPICLNAEIPISAVGLNLNTIASDNGKSLPANPFVGLRPFESEESFLFFGRDRQIFTLLQQLQSKHFLAVVGSSGCGKSSLIRAGLIPKLKAGFLVERRDHWRIAIMKPGQSPLTNLSRTVLELASESSSPDDIIALAGELRVAGAQAAIDILNTPLKEAEANILLVVDQFEELFRYDQPPAKALQDDDEDPASELTNDEIQRAENAKRELRRDEAASFVATILELSSQRELPIYIVMTMRSDFLGDCDAFHGLPETINETFYLVPRLTRQQRMEVIEKPIRLYGKDITSRLLDLVTNDVGDESDQLPVMQHALMRTWEKWKHNDGKDKPIDLPDYEAARMISGALSKDAEIALSELADVELTIAKRMFQALVETDAQGRNVRRPARLTQLAGIAGIPPSKILKVIDHFRRDGRCFLTLTSERVEDDPLVDISHESLIRQWDQLGKWVRSENYSKDQYTRLASAALRHSAGKGNLFTGTDLQLAVDWWESRKPNETWSLRYNRDFHLAEKFLAESKTQSDKEKDQAERQRVRELESERIQRQNKKLRRMMYALGAISLFAMFGVVGTGTATRKALTSLEEARTAKNYAEQARKEALSQTEIVRLETIRANGQANLAQKQAARADQQRYEAERQAGIAAAATARANREARLATQRLGDVQRAQEQLRVVMAQNEDALIAQRKKLIDDLGTNYLQALSAVTPKTVEEAVFTYERILGIYDGQEARGGQLSTLLSLGRLFDGSLLPTEKDPERALDYYGRSLPYFKTEIAPEKERKIETVIKMGDLFNGKERNPEAATKFEEAIALGYEPEANENRTVYRKLADLYEKTSALETLKQSRLNYERELAHAEGKLKTSGTSAWAFNKLWALIKLGIVNTRLHDQAAAEQNFKDAEAVATGPLLELSDFDALIRIGAGFNRPEEKQQRERFFQQAVHVAGGTGRAADAYRMIASSFLDSKLYNEGLEYLKRAADGYEKEDTKLAPVLRNIAATYEQMGRKEDAIEYYAKARQVYERLKSQGTVNALRYKIQMLGDKK